MSYHTFKNTWHISKLVLIVSPVSFSFSRRKLAIRIVNITFIGKSWHSQIRMKSERTDTAIVPQPSADGMSEISDAEMMNDKAW